MNWTVALALVLGLAAVFAWAAAGIWAGCKVIDKGGGLGFGLIVGYSVLAMPIILIIGLVV